jgi:hypothetical protein
MTIINPGSFIKEKRRKVKTNLSNNLNEKKVLRNRGKTKR